MKTIIILTLICGAIWFVVETLRQRSESSKSAAPAAAPARASGCKTSLACQHMHLGKAKDAGYDSSQITYCSACNGYTTRIDNCTCFFPRGCQNGICAYANDNKGGQCYCSCYNETVSTRESCPDYRDFFETEIGKSLLR